jgi:hypothetical protein
MVAAGVKEVNRPPSCACARLATVLLPKLDENFVAILPPVCSASLWWWHWSSVTRAADTQVADSLLWHMKQVCQPMSFGVETTEHLG